MRQPPGRPRGKFRRAQHEGHPVSHTVSHPASRPPLSIGLYLAVVQFFLALGWVVYAAYLPQLAQRAGMAARWVPWLLLADQLVFLVTDLLVGLASDRAARVLGRIGHAVLAATLLSTLAFVLLPWVAPLGSPLLVVGLTLVWAVTSSALRAPPLTLLGRYVARPAQPMTVALNSFGLGLAGAVAPYLGLQLKTLDPVWPFALSALSLAAVTLGMVAAERALARRSDGRAAAATGVPAAAVNRVPVWAFLLACAVGALAFQWHGFVASAPLALRFAPASDLPWLLPAFWVGFNLALLPAGWWSNRAGALTAMLLGATVAALGNAAAASAPTLPLLLAAQAIAGAGWALLLCSAFSAALVIGNSGSGRAGLMSGAVSSTLAGAALLRIGIVATTTPNAGSAVNLAGLAALGFIACAALLWRRRPTG